MNALGMPPDGKCSARGVCVCVRVKAKRGVRRQEQVLEGWERCLCAGEVLAARRGACMQERCLYAGEVLVSRRGAQGF